MKAARDPFVAAWLWLVAGLVAGMILLGGATRLTDSGLSITEWDFAKGVIPPLSPEAWAREFDLYRQTLEYQVQNKGMGLSEFQFIYWWEWAHRFFGKVIGLVFAAGFFSFWALGRLKGRFWPVLGLFALGGFQGYIGWWMVQSGLSDRLDVAPYRLATHLGVAFLILAAALWLAQQAWEGEGPAKRKAGPLALLLVPALYLQILLGALVAGNRSGSAYSDWPTIGGDWFPSAYAALTPFWRNLLENHAAVQFNHRTMGYLVAALAIAAALPAIRVKDRLAHAVAGLVAIQVLIGITAILLGAPLWANLLHQGVAVALWGTVVLFASPFGIGLPAREVKPRKGKNGAG